MKRVLIIHSVFDPVIEKDLAELKAQDLRRDVAERGENLGVEWLAENISDKFPAKTIPRGYDAYLIHHSDVNPQDLTNLRREQPQCKLLSLRPAYLIENDERELYDKFYFGWTRDNRRRILDEIGGER
jgi:hypothetical protein